MQNDQRADEEITVVPPASARALILLKGECIRITDPEGSQVSDFVAISQSDKREKFDQARTRVNNWSNIVCKGTTLYSNRNRPLLEVVEDDVGVHDLLFPACNSFVYAKVFHILSKTGCFENLVSALSQFGIEPDGIPNPLNIFMSTFADTKIGIRISPSKPGDSISMKALEDLIVAATACADDLSDCNGKKCKPINITVYH
jgi:uncharacterized protein YcgI (DUF1989 family)